MNDLCEMLFARRAHRSLKVLFHPVFMFLSVRSAFFSGIALPMKLSPAYSNKMACPAKFLARGELALPFRVARVSRLIGNFHTTGNSCGWQAVFALPVPISPLKSTPNARNATLNQVAFHNPVLSLASQMICRRRIIRRTLCSLSRPVCLS